MWASNIYALHWWASRGSSSDQCTFLPSNVPSTSPAGAELKIERLITFAISLGLGSSLASFDPQSVGFEYICIALVGESGVEF